MCENVLLVQHTAPPVRHDQDGHDLTAAARTAASSSLAGSRQVYVALPALFCHLRSVKLLLPPPTSVQKEVYSIRR
ncbi:uncharacterized [Tachysurus ichikawai]